MTTSNDQFREAPSYRFSDEKLEIFRNEFIAHCHSEEALFEKIMSAFPLNDPVFHRQQHESQIKAAAAQEAFWAELRVELAKKSLWGLITLLVGLILAGAAFKMGIHGAP